MKARPRAKERRVAEILSKEFVACGYKPVVRIPVLGRTGPDISLNELKFVIDVKSRIEVPKSVYIPLGPAIVHFQPYDLIGFRLNNFAALLTGEIKKFDVFPGEGQMTVVDKWFRHMDEWTKENEPDGITALVLHHSGIHEGRMPVGHSTFVISHADFLSFSRRTI